MGRCLSWMCNHRARLVIHSANVLMTALDFAAFFAELFHQLLLHFHPVKALHFGYRANSQKALCWSQFDCKLYSPRRRLVPVLFNVTLAIIAGFAGGAASVPYLSGHHPTQGSWCVLLRHGRRLSIRWSPSLCSFHRSSFCLSFTSPFCVSAFCLCVPPCAYGLSVGS